ncbi:MAG: hypothetical protein L0332_13535 [Chloroflexi bacterium]|nr:hypothetical protein [Chloroflexota bacterium]MCI0648721.1 hypothetical protein [Chloroflexota bacterium]MCI0727726.1 hypothetical protein [Chloroflexota bacterium]
MPKIEADSPPPPAPGVLNYYLALAQPNSSRTANQGGLPGYAAMPLAFLAFAKRLAELYEMVFPEQPEWLDEELDWVEGEDVAQAVAHFLERVAEHRFPLDTDLVGVDPDACEWVLWHIPVTPLGFAAGYSDEWEYFREPAQLLVKLSWSDYLVEDTQAYLAKEYPQLDIPAGFETGGLSRLLREMDLDGPLAALPELLDMVREETGNVWLDYAYEVLAETGGFPDWEDNHAALAEEWREASPVAERVYALMSWVEEDLTGRLALVMDTLLAADHLRQAGDEANDDDE